MRNGEYLLISLSELSSTVGETVRLDVRWLWNHTGKFQSSKLWGRHSSSPSVIKAWDLEEELLSGGPSQLGGSWVVGWSCEVALSGCCEEKERGNGQREKEKSREGEGRKKAGLRVPHGAPWLALSLFFKNLLKNPPFLLFSPCKFVFNLSKLFL